MSTMGARSVLPIRAECPLSRSSHVAAYFRVGSGSGCSAQGIPRLTPGASGTHSCFVSQYMFAVGLKKLVSSRVPAVMLIRLVSSRYIMIDDPQSGQNTLCKGIPVVPPGRV